MVFRRLRQAFGVGGPSVDTVLANPNTRPGLALEGQVNIQGGDHDVTIEYVELALVTKVEVETQDGEYDSTVAFQRQRVTGSFQVKTRNGDKVMAEATGTFDAPLTTSKY